MKKIILVAAMVLGFALAASAQPRAVGGKIGWGMEASYQHTIGEENFVEVDLGLNDFSAFNASAIYNFMIAKPDWTPRGEWGFYAGPGVSVGSKLINIDAQGHNHPYFHVSAAGMVGLEFSFWFPLQLSFDLKPQLGYGFGRGFHYNVMPSFGARYRF